MAHIVLGIGTSHSPLQNTPPEHWPSHAVRDHVHALYDEAGERVSFEQLRDRNGNRLDAHLSAETMRRHFARCEAALARLRAAVAAARPDVCVVIGDDQQEMFRDDNMPAFAVYWGERILCKTPDTSKWAPALKMAAWGYYGEEPSHYPCDPQLGRHIIERLMDEGFDLGQSARQPNEIGMSHAYTFLYRRELCPPQVPMVPVFINTYYPPNQPRVGRVIELGTALRKAIESYPADRRVALFASGGLSHFLVDESLDRAALAALSNGNPGELGGFPEARFKSGNSEIKNWLGLGAAMAPCKMTLLDYIPAYRSQAGTGCGLAFGLWQP